MLSTISTKSHVTPVRPWEAISSGVGRCPGSFISLAIPRGGRHESSVFLTGACPPFLPTRSVISSKKKGTHRRKKERKKRSTPVPSCAIHIGLLLSPVFPGDHGTAGLAAWPPCRLRMAKTTVAHVLAWTTCRRPLGTKPAQSAALCPDP